MAGRLSLLLTSPRIPAGLLSREGWHALDAADWVLGQEDEPAVDAFRTAGTPVSHPGDVGPAALARTLLDAAHADGGRQVVWVVSADGDPGLTDALAADVSRLTDPPEMELVLGSHDVQGARLLDLVAVMDRLRSPGGCPWDAEQTHTSLAKYLLEEAYEAVEAIESGDRDHLVEELGDVLLQVAFHARVGEEDPEAPFDIDDVAGAIVDKLVRRHPHVFADVTVGGPGDVEANWETIKAAERAEAGREADLLTGIPLGMPALARATKVVSRLQRSGRADLVAEVISDVEDDDPGARLLGLVAELHADGVDPETALRDALRQLTERVVPE